MMTRVAAWFAGIVLAATLVLLVAIEIDQRNAPPLVITVAERNDEIQVEIAGAVEQPGVYRRNRGDRVVDLIDAAGGLLPEADVSSINQAAQLIDGQRITVPFDQPEPSLALIASPSATALIDINRATVEELMELPGIGEVRAEAIIAFRNQHGAFSSIEELLYVEGISATLFEGIRPLISVGS
jgi:competence protein ComEA